MENILILDTSIASLNKGDNIIMECVEEELNFKTKDAFVLRLPTHIASFHSYQIWRNSNRLRLYKECKLKFVGGSNLLIPNMLTHFPQWNLNIFNYQAVKDCILVGVGAGAGNKTNFYTTYLYKKMLNKDFYHSVRDERTKKFLENIGIKAINTGCATMWNLTEKFCSEIPTKKSNNVIFTLTANKNIDEKDQKIIDILNSKYNSVYFWIQGIDDLEYLKKFKNTENIKLVGPTVKEFSSVLNMKDLDYVGTRLHAGIYAMRHKKRSLIIVIDERAREINKNNNLNCIEKRNIDQLGDVIENDIITKIKMPFEEIERWKSQFYTC